MGFLDSLFGAEKYSMSANEVKEYIVDLLKKNKIYVEVIDDKNGQEYMIKGTLIDKMLSHPAALILFEQQGSLGLLSEYPNVMITLALIYEIKYISSNQIILKAYVDEDEITELYAAVTNTNSIKKDFEEFNAQLTLLWPLRELKCSTMIEHSTNDRNNLAESLIKAVTLNNYDETINLIKLGADLSYKNKRSLTALHVASFRNNLVIVEKLLEHGADINVQDKYGATPLITATIEGHTEVVKYLVQSNADIFIKDTEGRTALKIALEIEYSNNDADRSDICIELINTCEITKWSVYYDEAEYALIRASELGNIDIVKKLINAGMYLDFQNWRNNRTALIQSLVKGNIEVAKLLIKAGAKTDIQSDKNYQFTAIGWASRDGYEDIIDELIKVNADLNLVHNIDHIKHTPLLEAIGKEYESIAIKLVEAGADTEIY